MFNKKQILNASVRFSRIENANNLSYNISDYNMQVARSQVENEERNKVHNFKIHNFILGLSHIV